MLVLVLWAKEIEQNATTHTKVPFNVEDDVTTSLLFDRRPAYKPETKPANSPTTETNGVQLMSRTKESQVTAAIQFVSASDDMTVD